MKSKYLIIGVIVILILAGILLVARSAGKKNAAQNAMTNIPATAMPKTTASGSAGASVGAMTKATVKEFKVEGSNFQFVPKVLNVNQGDTVKIVFESSGGLHDFVIDAFGVKTKVIPTGASDTVQFVADKKGTFQFYCSVANHRAMGMVGTLVVQ